MPVSVEFSGVCLCVDLSQAYGVVMSVGGSVVWMYSSVYVVACGGAGCEILV